MFWLVSEEPELAQVVTKKHNFEAEIMDWGNGIWILILLYF
jgi:hypothetical protein